MDLEKVPVSLALVSLQGQLQLTIGNGLLYFSFYLSFIFGEVGEVGGVMFDERKVDSYLFYTVRCLFTKSEERENKMHYDETLTLDRNEAFNFHNVEWRLENVPNLLLCVNSGFLWHLKWEKKRVVETSGLFVFLKTFYVC